MADELIIIGTKLELNEIFKSDYAVDTDVRKYVSQVLDVFEDANGKIIRVAMPIYEGRLIPLQVGTYYKVFFYCLKGMYTARCQIVGRSKEVNIYTMDIVLTSALEKFQRRNYYRLPCYMETKIWELTESELFRVLRTGSRLQLEAPGEDAFIVDLSGGGVRLKSRELYGKNHVLQMQFTLNLDKDTRQMQVLGKVISSYSVENDDRFKETRLAFLELKKEEREFIVKYIFQEQRKIRQKEQG